MLPQQTMKRGKMMKQERALRFWHVGLIAALAVAVLAGCGGEQATPAPADEGGSETYTSAVLDTSYPDALNASSQLALGTIHLEESEIAVTPEQATALLPLWQALQGGVTVQAEVDAVLAQIERTMAPEQLEAIAAMQLTQNDLGDWAQSQGLGMGAGDGSGQRGGGQELSPEELATRQAERGGGEMPPEMATRRAEMENMSDEEQEAMRATMQAGGGMAGGDGGRPGAGSGAGRQQRRGVPLFYECRYFV